MSDSPGVVRSATMDDAAACAAIYAPYVLDTAITFETEVPSTAELTDRIASYGSSHAWLVLERDRAVLGYAYAYGFSPRAAYNWSCETSIYLAPSARGTGAGRALYEHLLPLLGERGYRRAVARIALPNPASIAFHQRFGFTEAGVLRRIGWKHGAWHDVAFLQRDLGDPTAPPSPEPYPLQQR